MTTITIRVSEKTAKALADVHGNKSKGAEIAVKSYAEIRPRMLLAMKGRFNRNELSYLVDIGNGHFFQPETSGVGFWTAQIEDADNLDGLGEKWNVDVPALVDKIKSLNPAEVYFWQELINLFWHGKDADHDLDQFIKKYH